MAKLTPKQELFCQSIVSGLNSSDAYRAAYSTDNMKDATIHRNAKTLMDDNKISTRIIELGKPVIEAVQLKAQDILESIQRLSEKAENKDRFGEALKGQELLGKHLKMFTDKVLVGEDEEHPIGWNINIIDGKNEKS